MIEEVLPNLFRVRIELPQTPAERMNSAYIIKGERNLIVDAGVASRDCRRIMEDAFQKIGVELEESDFFVTHFHMDHLSLALRLRTPSSRIYFNEIEAGEFWSDTRWEERFQCARENGFPENEINEVRGTHPGYKAYLKRPPRASIHFHMVGDGTVVHAGDYRFTVMVTPGHSKSHLCLYDAEKGLFFSGDHLLGQLVPAVSDWSNETDSLGDYLYTLTRIEKNNVAHVLPGHGEPFDFSSRIEEIRTHHERRLAQILGILGGGAKSAYEVAAELAGGSEGGWDTVSVLQKWLTAGEMVAYLTHLEKRGKAIRQKNRMGSAMMYCA
jgi:glyoxylase-like metal-dependent hydrolase (beta-lactamase superfamily II)